MRKFFLLCMLATLFICTPVLAAGYIANFTITEGNGTDYDMLGVMVYSANEWMADNGFMSSTANDTRVKTLGEAEKPWMVTDNRTLTAISVPANSQTNLKFSSGETAAASMDIITGNGGYITTTDAAAIEPSDNFTLTFSGYYRPDTAVNYLIKLGALSIVSDGAGDAVATIGRIAGSANISPNGAGTQTNLAVSGGANYAAVDDPVASPDDAATYVYKTAAAYSVDTYALENGTFYASDQIVSVTVFFRTRTIGTGYAYPVLGLGGNYTNGTEVLVTSSWTTRSEVLSRPGGGSWSYSDIASLEGGIALKGNGVDPCMCTQVYVQVAYQPIELSVADAVAEAKVFTLSADTTTIEFDVDGTSDSVASSAAAPNSANNWVWTPDGYFDYITLEIDGVEVLRYEPNDMIAGTVLPDRATGDGIQNGAFTWGSNPAGVTATLGSMASSSQPEVGATTDTTPRDILPTTSVSDWYGDGTVTKPTTLNNPFRPFITAISDNTSLSEIQVWRWLGAAGLLLIVVMAAKGLRGHMGITSIVAGVGVGALVAFDNNIFPLYLLVLSIGCFVGGIIAERSPSL